MQHQLVLAVVQSHRIPLGLRKAIVDFSLQKRSHDEVKG
jgi:hypothetical protein